MSVFKDKRVFGIKHKNSSGITTAGQVCANDVILWVIFLLPVNIVLHGAGQCITFLGLFAGNVFCWIFLSKRMNSYAELSPRKIHNAPELFEVRYNSRALKYISSVVWILTLGLILVSVLKVIVSVVAYFMRMNEIIWMAIIVAFLVLGTILVDNRFMGLIKTIVFCMVICVCLLMIVMIFHKYEVREILDNYRRAGLAGGTSIYLNILYYDGQILDAVHAISMAGIGLGAIAMPLMYKGVINIKDARELDAGRIWAVIFEGFTILSSGALTLLVVPVLFPDGVSADMNSFQVYNLLLKKLLGDETYSYPIRAAILFIFIASVVVMLESLMRNICEHVRGMVNVPPSTGTEIKLMIDIFVVIITGAGIFLFGVFAEYDRENAIVSSWEMCAAALAAPLIVTLMYRKASKAGMYAGIFSGIIVFFMWHFSPLIQNSGSADGIRQLGDVIGFGVSFALCMVVSMLSKNKADTAELEIFDRMVRDQA